MTVTVANLAAYSIQLAALAAAALVASHAVGLRAPRVSLRFWQVVLAAALFLPLLQPRGDAARSGLEASFTLLTNSAAVAAFAERGIEPARWLLIVMVAGAVARLLWLAVGFVRLRAMVAAAGPAPALDALAAQVAQSVGARATLAVTDGIDSPATIGARRPMILVPRRLLDQPASVQRAVITHELLHVRRRDWLQTLAEECWCAVLWFHPAARLIARRLSLARETVVDEATIRLTRDRRAYAEALLAFSAPQPHLPGVTPFIGRRHLSQRISLIAEEEVMSRARTVASLTAAVVLSAAVTSSAIAAFPISEADAGQGQVYEPGNGVTLPSVVKEVKPVYTAAAMQNKIQGSVWLRVVVGDTGDVTEVTVTKSLDAEHGLDEEATKAAWQWKFKPGTKEGKPVPVRVTVELTFTLKK